MRSILLENKIGGQYFQIVRRLNGVRGKLKFLFDDNCITLDVTQSKVSEFVVVFPFNYNFILELEREQRGTFGYGNLINIFFKNKLKHLNLKKIKFSVVNSVYSLKNEEKNVYIGLKMQSYIKQDERKKVFEELFQYFSLNFEKNIKELKSHMLDSNPSRYKYIN
jgi:hypothetical protein